jgi:murein DD-endopeptidase MepM/ murein hydrolase activator NlpD
MLGACAAPDPSHVHVTLMGTQSYNDSRTIVARSGDNVYKIAKNMGVDTRALIDKNNLSPPYSLAPGQVLRIPLPETIRTHEGDTLYSIARTYGADQSEIVKLNNLHPPYNFGDMQEIKLPTTTNTKNGITATVEDAPTIDNAPVTAESLSGPINTTTDASGNKVHTSAAGVIKEQEMAPPSGATQAKSDQKLGETKVASIEKPVEAPKSKPSLGTGTPSFSWPVNGSTLSAYGPKDGGRHNDGINIGAPLGTPVRTAAAGDVVYTGDNVAGFGNLVLIRHSGGFATAYAHLQKVLVKQGDHVSSGQAIAQIGKTGNVSSPQLHFEIRKGTQAVNPKPYLP